jgi:hypothetical protein
VAIVALFTLFSTPLIRRLNPNLAWLRVRPGVRKKLFLFFVLLLFGLAFEALNNFTDYLWPSPTKDLLERYPLAQLEIGVVMFVVFFGYGADSFKKKNKRA